MRVNPKTLSRIMKSLGKVGGLARAKKLTKAQRLESSRKANAAKAKKMKGKPS